MIADEIQSADIAIKLFAPGASAELIKAPPGISILIDNDSIFEWLVEPGAANADERAVWAGSPIVEIVKAMQTAIIHTTLLNEVLEHLNKNFKPDEPVNGADLVDWMVAWQTRAAKALGVMP